MVQGQGEGGGQVNTAPSPVGSATLQLRTEVAPARPSEATEPASVPPPSLSTIPHVPPTIHTPTLKNVTLQTKNFLAKGKREISHVFSHHPPSLPHTQAGWYEDSILVMGIREPVSGYPLPVGPMVGEGKAGHGSRSPQTGLGSLGWDGVGTGQGTSWK